MKKIALTVGVLASLGLAACNNTATEEANTEATDLNATTDEALNDVNAATESADNALDNAAVDTSAEATDNAANVQ
jgi:outer membrane murein-binding lipoprotein Lpp